MWDFRQMEEERLGKKMESRGGGFWLERSRGKGDGIVASVSREEGNGCWRR
jgi:hypothetical protein